MAKKKAAAETGGHDFADPDVVSAEAALRDLLRTLDDLGVVLTEEQYRAMPESERNVTIEWARLRKDGARVGCPIHLHAYATTALIDECNEHNESQEAARRIRVRCKFNKPTAVLASGDKEGDAIKWSVVIPADDIKRASVAEDFFCGKRVKAEFSLRSVDQWDNVLPEVDETLPEIIECETDIRGYARLMKGWKTSFVVSTDLVDDNEANRHFANHEGSIRFTVIGDIPKKGKADSLEPAKVTYGEAKTPPLEGQKELPLTGNENQLVSDGQFDAPDVYQVALSEQGAAGRVYIGVGSNGKFYESSDLWFQDSVGVEMHNDLDHPLYDEDAGYVSLLEAQKHALETMIDFATENDASTTTLNELKDHLRKLDQGKLLPVEPS